MDSETSVEIAVEEERDEIDLPDGVLDLFAAEGQTAAETVGDLLVVSCTQRLHGVVAHGSDEPSDDLRDLEAAMREQFEERFGASFAEVTGHSH